MSQQRYTPESASRPPLADADRHVRTTIRTKGGGMLYPPPQRCNRATHREFPKASTACCNLTAGVALVHMLRTGSCPRLLRMNS